MKLTTLNYEAIADLFDAYHSEHATWGPLHIAMDDGNISRDNFQFCLDYAIEQKDWAGAFLAEILLQLNDASIQRMIDEPHATIDDILLGSVMEIGG
jgi:hypothetical protein